MLSPERVTLVETLQGQTLKRKEIVKAAEKLGIPNTQLNWIVYKCTKQPDGRYLVPGMEAFDGVKTRKPRQSAVATEASQVEAVIPFAVPEKEKSVTETPKLAVQTKTAELDSPNLVPTKDPLFVKFGVYSNVLEIIKSGMFYPVYVTGLSGNGKTYSISQACAATKRELIRVNITCETDESDLIGSISLVSTSKIACKLSQKAAALYVKFLNKRV